MSDDKDFKVGDLVRLEGNSEGWVIIKTYPNGNNNIELRTLDHRMKKYTNTEDLTLIERGYAVGPRPDPCYISNEYQDKTPEQILQEEIAKRDAVIEEYRELLERLIG